MKRTATTLVLLAGFGGGGCVSPDSQTRTEQPIGQPQTTHTGGFGTVTRGQTVNGVQGPLGEPIMRSARGATPGMGGASAPNDVVQAGGANTLIGTQSFIRPVGVFNRNRVSSSDGCTNCVVPGVGGRMVRDAGPSSGYGPPPGMYGPPPGMPDQGRRFGPTDPGYPAKYGPTMPAMPRHGILPVPGQGMPGQVAAYGALMPGQHGGNMPGSPGMGTGRSSINFTGPAGMNITWQLPDGNFNDPVNALTAPKEYNFLQGQVYRLRLTQILPDFPGRSFYPTLEVSPASQKTLTFLAHSSIPITFTADDFAQAKAGNLVVKVVYLPDPLNQDFSTIIGAEEVVSTRLEPGADPVAEAQRRGTILAIIRMGNIDLENKVSPSMVAPPPGVLLPGPRPVPKDDGGLNSLPSFPPALGGPLPPNPPGTANVNQPAALPEVPKAPTDLPPAPISPLAPIAPEPKPK